MEADHATPREVPHDLARARRAWPGIRAVSAERFAAHVARHAAGRSAHLADLYLALGCALGDPVAMRAFELAFAGDVARAARRSATRGLDEGELRQRTHALLFVGRDGSPPRIAEYGARGPLRAWVRVVLARQVLDHQRVVSGHEAPPAEADVVCALESLAIDPELGLARAEVRSAVRRALERALESLSAEERALLRHRYVERLGIDGVALAHGLHRATAARHLARAEATLRRVAHAVLSEELRVARGEVGELIGSALSRLELSLSRILV